MTSLRLLLASALSSLSTLLAVAVQAQLIPDQTLGSETSIVTPNVEVRGKLTDLVEGGAARGPNLFHSFSDFNVLDNERVYFRNPAGIESIVNRVTGNDLSNIFGTLGVDGEADLFLINPNGIVFGADASLDIEGSLYATTAEAISLGEEIFSTFEPEQSQLLDVTPNVSFFNYITADSGNIVSRGKITSGSNVTLSANNLDLQGQLTAGEDLSILAVDTVTIRDNSETPFIAFSGDRLLVQGNQQIDIVALSHPDSGLFSEGNMVLRSRDNVSGDAHYFSGEAFSVEQLDGSEGRLLSPIVPVIRAYGDVSIGSYEGSSLHVVAGGSVEIDDIIIRFPEQGLEGDDFLRDSINLSNGIVVGIDGSAQPTVDIRAGVLPSAVEDSSLIGLSGFNPGTDFLSPGSGSTPDPSGGDITIGTIWVAAANGRVLLTNQYQPNLQLPNGTISISGDGSNPGRIDLRNFNGPSGEVFLDSRGSIDIIDSFISTTSLGRVGDVILLAGEDITLEGKGGLSSISTAITGQGSGEGGTVFLSAQGDIGIIDSFISTAEQRIGESSEVFIDARGDINIIDSSISTTSPGNVGDVVLSADKTVTLAGRDSLTSVSTNVAEQEAGEGGNIFIDAENLNVFHGTQLQSSVLGQGSGGSIVVNVRENTLFSGRSFNNETPNLNLPVARALSRIEPGGMGQGGSVFVTTKNLTVDNGAQLSASTFGIGDAGNVVLQASENLLLQGNMSAGSGNSAVLSTVERDAVGNGGDIYASARQIEVLDGAILAAITSGQGSAGNVILEIDDVAKFQGSSTAGISAAITRATSRSTRDAGAISISARQLEVLDGAQLSSSTAGIGNAGNIVLNIRETSTFDGFSSNVPVGQTVTVSSASASSLEGSSGRSGEIYIDSRDLEVTNGAQIISSVFGQGSSGRIEIDVDDTIYIGGDNPVDSSPSGIFSSVRPQGSSNGGDINISARSLILDPDGDIDARHDGVGNSGNISILVDDLIQVRDGDFRTSATFGSAGNIDISADSIVLQGDSDIKTNVDSGLDVGEGTTIFLRQGNSIRSFFYRATESDGGSININANVLVALDDSDILTFTDGGRGGAVNLGETTFLGENYTEAPPDIDPNELDENSQVDINTSGPLFSGDVFISDVSFIENSLSELSSEITNTVTLTAGSCITRTNDDTGSLIVTGNEAMPQRPEDLTVSVYPTGSIQHHPAATLTSDIQEPHRIYQLTDGRLVLSHECEN